MQYKLLWEKASAKCINLNALALTFANEISDDIKSAAEHCKWAGSGQIVAIETSVINCIVTKLHWFMGLKEGKIRNMPWLMVLDFQRPRLSKMSSHYRLLELTHLQIMHLNFNKPQIFWKCSVVFRVLCSFWVITCLSMILWLVTWFRTIFNANMHYCLVLVKM